MRALLSYLLRAFLKGLIILAPIIITVYLIIYIFQILDSIIPYFPRGLGFLINIGTITLVGYLGTRFTVGQYIFNAFDRLMMKTPFIKYIYSSIKDTIDSFVGDNRRFNKPVWLKTKLEPEEWRIGFVTQKDMSYLGMPGKVAVYLPHSYAISGWVVIAEAIHTKPVTQMTAAEALKFAVSGGVTISDESTKEEAKAIV